MTYTFTGRNASSVTSSKTLELYVSDGTAPKGVSIANISGISSEDSENGIDNVDIGNTVGISLIPQYLVRPGEEGVITFKNFRYEIASINWTSRSQVPLLTSKTSTWAVKGDNKNTTGTLTKEWDSNTYETSQFVTDKGFAGISALHISCDTKQALHGHSMKDFIISYYEPEITISCDNELALSSATSGTKSTTVSASISNHKGAFSDTDIKLSYSDVDASVATISGNTITSGTTAGSVLVTAKLTYDGTVIATATKKVQIGQFDFNFEQVSLDGEDYDTYCEYFSNTYKSYVHAYRGLLEGTTATGDNKFGDTNTGLRKFSEKTLKSSWSVFSGTTYSYSGDNEANYWMSNDRTYCQQGENSGNITKLSTLAANDYSRYALQRINHHQFVSAYSSVETTYTFQLKAEVSESSSRSAKNGYGINMFDFGSNSSNSDSPAIWPDEETNDSYYAFGTSTAMSSGTKAYNAAFLTSGYHKNASDNGYSNTFYPSHTFTFTNTANETGYVDRTMTEQLGAYAYTENTNAVYASGKNSYTATFDYTSRSKTITYYLYINYDANGGSGTMTTTEASNTDTNAKGTVVANSFTKADDTSNTYKFVSWNTKADGSGTTYLPGDGINIYNSTDDCGSGPITLYAQWKATPIANKDAKPSEDDNVYSLWGNGGTIKDANKVDQEVIAAQFVLGATASDVTPATRTGYTFNGYYTSTTGGTQIFNASGAAVGDGTIISTTGRWLAENDVYLYAQWTENPSDPVTSITVNLNGNKPSAATGDVTLSATSITCTKGSSENCNISTLTPTLSGYKFAGWYTNATGNADGSIMVYNANGEAVYVESYSTDSEGNITPVYTALNPTFFYTSGKYVGSESPFDADFTIYAHWIKENTKLSFNEYVTTNKEASWSDGSTTGYFDSNSAPAYEEGEYDEVSITRALNANKWNTVCFPFDIYEDQVKELFTYVKMFNDLEVDGNTAKMKFADCSVMMAGVPYFVKIKSDSNLSGLTLSNVSVCKTPSPISITKDNTTVTMVGEFNTHIGLEDGLLYLQNDKFYISGNTYNGKKITGNSKGFRCYFTNTTKTNEAKACNLLSTSIDLEGYDGYSGTTDVEQLEITPDNCTFSTEPTEVYDLCGRKLAGKPEKGIYLTNGKKYIAR